MSQPLIIALVEAGLKSSIARSLIKQPSSLIDNDENGEFKKLLTPINVCSDVGLEPGEHPIGDPETANALEGAMPILSLDSAGGYSGRRETGFDGHDDVDHEDSGSESEDYSIEERWVTQDEDFEAKVLRATENNFELAAQLIPLLYAMFHQEQSPVVGPWETCGQKRAGNSSDQPTGTSGGVSSSGTNTSQTAHGRKRQRNIDEGSGGGKNDNQKGNGDGDGGNFSSADGSNILPLVCPLNGKDPSKYNGSYGDPNVREGVYRVCEARFKSFHRLR